MVIVIVMYVKNLQSFPTMHFSPFSRTQESQTPLQLAISNQLPLVVDAICTRGADMSVVDEKGDPPLWLALENGLEDIASTLVRHTQTKHEMKVDVIHSY